LPLLTDPPFCRCDQVFALGVYSVFEQILESIPAADRTEIFNAYINSLGEDPETYRRDAAALEAAAGVLTASEPLAPDAQGTEVQVRGGHGEGLKKGERHAVRVKGVWL
jgi:hypothetical protein